MADLYLGFAHTRNIIHGSIVHFEQSAALFADDDVSLHTFLAMPLPVLEKGYQDPIIIPRNSEG